MRGHEVDVVGADELRGHDEVALVLAVLVVHDDDHASRGDLLQRLLDGGEIRRLRAQRLTGFPRRLTSFSRYLARMSTSRLTGVPGSALPRLVRCSVSGMSDTSKEPSSIRATVSETPSTVIEPFSTT